MDDFNTIAYMHNNNNTILGKPPSPIFSGNSFVIILYLQILIIKI